jgi:NADH:ubiquinone oxidoreductase subunit K
MTDRYTVYTKVLKVLKQMLQMQDQRHMVTLAMMVAGIVTGRNAQLSAMSSEILIAAKEKSIEMRLRRWVKHSEIDAEVMYMPFALQILEALAALGLVLVMDGSQAGRGCMVLMVGVLYKKLALPIAWIVYKDKKGHTTAQRHIQALEKVLPMLPAGYEVVLLGDAEYDTIEMIAWVQENTTWSYVLRTSPQIYVQEGQHSQPIRDYPMMKGQVFQRHQVGFTQRAAVSLNLIGWWSSSYGEPLYLVTNLSNGYQACKYYRRRFQIETFFSDQKSRGFHIHKSHLTDPVRLGRMLLAACLAYLWMICQGLWVIAEKKTGLIDRTDRIDKSLFRRPRLFPLSITLAIMGFHFSQVVALHVS